MCIWREACRQAVINQGQGVETETKRAMGGLQGGTRLVRARRWPLEAHARKKASHIILTHGVEAQLKAVSEDLNSPPIHADEGEYMRQRF